MKPPLASIMKMPLWASSSATDLEVMRRLDRLHLEFPFAGSRMLRGLLAAEGCKVGPPACQNADEADGEEALHDASAFQARQRSPGAITGAVDRAARRRS